MDEIAEQQKQRWLDQSTMTRHGRWTIGALLIVATVSLVGPFVGVESAPATSLTNLVHLKTIGGFLQGYCLEHDGLLPETLEIAMPPTDGRDKLLAFTNPKTREKSDWQYLAANRKLVDLPKGFVVVASPVFRHRWQKVQLRLRATDGKLTVEEEAVER